MNNGDKPETARADATLVPATLSDPEKSPDTPRNNNPVVAPRRLAAIRAEVSRLFADDPAKPVSAAAALVLIILYGWSTNRRFVEWNFGDEVFLRLGTLASLAAAALIAFAHIWRNTSAVGTQWWSIGGKLDDPSWDDVWRMTVGHPEDDPVLFKPRRRPAVAAAKAITSYVVLGCFFLEVVTFVVAAPILPRMLTRHTPIEGSAGISLDLSANLTAFIALIAAAISIYFTHRQLQAKVKADSRQSWINTLRAHIASFIALSDAVHEAPTSRTRHAAQLDLTSRRIEMELMLNPSEKDHRLLMYLSLRLAFFEYGDNLFDQVHDVRNIKNVTNKVVVTVDQCNWEKLFGPIPPKGPARDTERGDLIGYVMRLSHVVLKREWERVKATR